MRHAHQKHQRTLYTSHLYKTFHSTEVRSVIQHIWKPLTRRIYTSTVQQFLDYCHIHAIPNVDTLPALESLLCDFAASFVGRVAGKTVSAKCDAIHVWHIKNGYSYQGNTQLEYMIKGIENQ